VIVHCAMHYDLQNSNLVKWDYGECKVELTKKLIMVLNQVYDCSAILTPLSSTRQNHVLDAQKHNSTLFFLFLFLASKRPSINAYGCLIIVCLLFRTHVI
jgi:hypothetical protein